MRLDLYQQETERIAFEQARSLDDAHDRLRQGGELSRLEQGGVLHALQVLIENAIGKAKHQIKCLGFPVPVSAHDAFAALADRSMLNAPLAEWNAVIGLRNRIVHDYMNVDIHRVLALVIERKYSFIVDFLRSPFIEPGKPKDQNP
jgi:uncharacterized protein YutE (UPF0331/DUF86 family)